MLVQEGSSHIEGWARRYLQMKSLTCWWCGQPPKKTGCNPAERCAIEATIKGKMV
jgi:hypothetical protein